ncbi:uncharacterized protein LOC124844835 [Vigna umbellata]|uniref:uncharacterized protein LOC124844835 n=1 Tax=Vigna umbellata TaxID=87088 RepID=UPI001F5E4577|nr:uncharacterized protein LOC124844835 [Vigna umbellata]
MAQTRNKVTITEKLLATKSSSYSTNLWDCGSTLYDSFELNSFNRQLHSAIAKSPLTRTLSMPHLPERSLHALPVQPPPPSIAMPRKFFNFSRSFQKLIRSVFKSNNKTTTTTSFSFHVPEKYSKERFYVVYDKSGPVLSTIPEVPEFEIGAPSPEISSLVRRSSSERLITTNRFVLDLI